MSAKEAAIELIRQMPDDVPADVLFDELGSKLGLLEGPVQDDDPEFVAELERRADAIKNGTAVGRPVDEVMRELRERFR